MRSKGGVARMIRQAELPRWVALTAALALCTPASAATIVVNNLNGPGEGFNDPAPATPVTGNPATTVGAQRLAAFQAAADEWGATLASDVTITIDAEMTSLSCSKNSAVLGSAGPRGFIERDFPEAPAPDTWYPQALVNALRGFDIDPARGEVAANFNQDIGQPGCLESLGWSYVIGAPTPPGTIPFTDTVLHEIAHGLGFLTFADRSTGALLQGRSDSYTQHLLDETPTPTPWNDLTDEERAASAIDTGQLTWNGPSVASVADLLTEGRHPTSGRVRIYAPATLVGGSSVSHFDTALRPREIMEPSLRLPNRKRLTNHLMLDLGWSGLAEVSVDIDDGQSSVVAGSPTRYILTVRNDSAADLSVIDAQVSNTAPAGFNPVGWTCSAASGASCGATSGTGDIAATVALPQGGSVVFFVDGVIDAGFSGPLVNTAGIALPPNLLNTAAPNASDTTLVIEAAAVAAIVVSGISGDTDEAGQSASFEVVLASAPAADVTLPLESSDPGEGTLSTSSLTFTGADWATPQVVTVFGENDDIDDGDIGFIVQLGPTSSADAAYDGLAVVRVSVTNRDDDTAGVVVSESFLETDENGAAGDFTLVLESEPTAPVRIGLASSDASEGVVTPATLTFTAANWNVPQVVTVTGVGDDLNDGDVFYTVLTAPADSTDPIYDGMDAADVSALNIDRTPLPPEVLIDGFEAGTP